MDLKRTSLEIANIDPAGIDAFFRGVSSRGIELHDFLLLRGSYVCCEAEWSPYKKDDLHMLYSLSKAFTAVGIGFAVQEGLLHTEDTVYSFFREELKKDGVSISDRAKQIRIEHLLTMSTGQTEEPPILNYEFEGNWVAEFLKIEPVHEPGSAFFYDTTATYVLSAILTRVTGETLANYLKPRFFDPLGITDFAWDSSPEGNSLGGIGLNLSVESIAKLGVFLLQEGKWEGNQLLSADWIRRMTANLVRSAGGDVYDDGDNWGYGYGYQIWQCIPDGVYRGDGAYGQFVIVAPKENLIIATLSGTEDMGGLMDEMWKHLLPACGPVDPSALSEADSEKKHFMVSCPAGSHDLPPAFLCSYDLDDNEEHITGLSLSLLSGDPGTLTITCSFADGRTRCLHFGYRGWRDNRMDGVKNAHYYTCGDICTAQTAGAWAWENNRLKLKLCYLNGPLHVTAKCRLLEQTLTITAQKHCSMAPKTSFSYRGHIIH